MIFGARGVTYTSGKGTFFCPGCHDQKSYRRRRVRRFATVYFVPILPMDLLGEYIECPMCGGSFGESVLAEDPTRREVLSDGLLRVLQRVLVHMVLADGQLDDSDVETARSVFNEVTGQTWSEASIRRQLEEQQSNKRLVLSELSGLTACLNRHAKELVVIAACRVASANGAMRKLERQWLGRIADTLEVPHHFLVNVIATMPEPN